MFRIRRIDDVTSARNLNVLAQVQQILRKQFPALSDEHTLEIAEKLHNPFLDGLQYTLLVADDPSRTVKGEAIWVVRAGFLVIFAGKAVLLAAL